MGSESTILTTILLIAGLTLTDDASPQLVGGRVVSTRGEPVAGAQVSLLTLNGGGSGRTDTDENGVFLFQLVNPAKMFMEVEGVGFEAWSAGPVEIRKGDTLFVALFVAPEGVPPDPILILSSNRPWYEFLQPAGLWEFWERRERFEPLGSGSFYTQADLRTWKGQPLTVTLSALSPFLYAEPYGGGPSALQLKGPRGCTPLVFVDGHQIQQGTEGSEWDLSLGRSEDLPDARGRQVGWDQQAPVTPIDHFIRVSQIAALEIYRGASDIPGEFRVERVGSRCGAVVVWSQRGPTG